MENERSALTVDNHEQATLNPLDRLTRRAALALSRRRFLKQVLLAGSFVLGYKLLTPFTVFAADCNAYTGSCVVGANQCSGPVSGYSPNGGYFTCSQACCNGSGVAPPDCTTRSWRRLLNSCNGGFYSCGWTYC